jgi:hypothetical protein
VDRRPGQVAQDASGPKDRMNLSNAAAGNCTIGLLRPSAL